VTAAEALLKRIVLQHAHALPTDLVQQAKQLLGNASKRDPWSRFLCLPDAGTRKALGALAAEFGGPAVCRAIESILANPPKVAAFAKLRTALKGGDGIDSIDPVGNCLPPAL